MEEGQAGRTFKVAGDPPFCLLSADGAGPASGYDPTDLPNPSWPQHDLGPGQCLMARAQRTFGGTPGAYEPCSWPQEWS